MDGSVCFDASAREDRKTRLGRLFALFRRWRRRSRERSMLAQFDDRMLRDIGISRTEQMWECEKPFWRA